MLNTEKTITMFFCTWQKKKFHRNNKLNLIVWMLPINQKHNSWMCVRVNENVNWDVSSSKLSKSYYVLQFLIDITGLYITWSIYFAHFFPTAGML